MGLSIVVTSIALMTPLSVGMHAQSGASKPAPVTTNVAFLAKGSEFVTTTSDGDLRLHGADAAVTTTIRLHRGKVRALAISTDGRLAATAGADGRIRVVDLATKKPVADAAHDVVTVGFSADGKTLRAVTAQGELLALDPKNGALRTKLPCPDRRRTSGAFIFGDLIVQAYEDG